MTIADFRSSFLSGSPISIAIVGDSTTTGFGANGGVNVWTNGKSYGCMNNPSFSPNWDSTSPLTLITSSGLPTQAMQDNKAIPSAVRLLRTYIEQVNPQSKVYNFGGSGWVAGTHVSNNTIASIAALNPKPQVVFLALGINSAKNNQGQDADLRTLVSQVISNGMIPILVKEHNVGVAGSPSGNWSATATPDTWYPMDNWPSIRANIDQIASDYGITVIDLGDASGTLDITLLYDPFHPSAKGYREIFKRYKDWLDVGAIKIKGDPERHSAISNGALRIKTASGIHALKLTSDIKPIRVKTSQGTYSIV